MLTILLQLLSFEEARDVLGGLNPFLGRKGLNRPAVLMGLSRLVVQIGLVCDRDEGSLVSVRSVRGDLHPHFPYD